MMSRGVLLACAGVLLGLMPLLAACTSSADKEAVAALKARADQVASNKQVVHTFLGLFMSGEWDKFDQVIASNCVLHEPGGMDIVGPEAMKSLWQEAYAALKNLNASTIAEISEGDIYMTFVSMEATYEGDYMGKPIAGVPVKFNQTETMRIVDGKIVEWWVGFDRLWMSEQLGFELKAR
jgi:predicted ester cyclase